MTLRRGLREAVGAIATALVFGPTVAVAVGAIVDRGPTGEPRTSALHLALVVWDPFARQCLSDSLIVAAVSTAASLALGGLLGASAARKRFWFRALTLEINAWTASLHPLFAALGVRLVLDQTLGPAWRDRSEVVLISLMMVYSLIGTQRVVSATIDGFESVSESAADSARLCGAGEFSIARTLLRPLARPRIARVCAGLFALAFFDPCGPLMLGARRTLGYRLFDLATRENTLPRAAAFMVCGGFVACLGLGLIGRWGGEIRSDRREIRFLSAGGSRVWPASALMLLWSLVPLIPFRGLLRAVQGLPTDFLREGEVMETWIKTATWSAVAASTATGLAILSSGSVLGRSMRDRAMRIPGFASALGLLILPGLLEGAAKRTTSPALAEGLVRLAALLDPAAPWALIVALSIVVSSIPARMIDSERRMDRDRFREIAITLGASRFQAWRLSMKPFRKTTVLRAWLVCFAVAATDANAGLLLAPTSLTRPLGATIVRFSIEGGRMPEAAALALIGAFVARLASSIRRGACAPDDWIGNS